MISFKIAEFYNRWHRYKFEVTYFRKNPRYRYDGFAITFIDDNSTYYYDYYGTLVKSVKSFNDEYVFNKKAINDII